MKLYFFGHEMVSQPYYPRIESLEGLLEIRGAMVGMMRKHGLNGLAAPQIGIQMQLVIVKLQSGSYLDLVNPRITRMYGYEPEQMETCISCPPGDNGCLVRRMDTIHLVAGHAGNVEDMAELTFTGPDSRIIQHEIDHLEGTFFFNRAKIADCNTVLKRFRRWQHERQQNPKPKEQPWHQPQ